MTTSVRRFQAEADIWAEIDKLRKERVRYVKAPVTAVNVVDPASPTFTIAVEGQEDGAVQPLSGNRAPAQFVPQVGPELIYQPGRIAENAITEVELAPASVPLEALQFSLDDYAGSKIELSTTEPPGPHKIGDIWLKQTVTGPPPQYETWRWNGTTYAMLRDQGITDALVEAATAQATADSKTRVYVQATDPNTPPGTLTADNDGEIWRDTGNGNRESVWGVTATVSRTNLALNPSFEYDALGTFTGTTAPARWFAFSNGATGTVTRSIVATGATSGSKAAKVVSSSFPNTASAGIGLGQIFTAAPGDVFRIQATFSLAVTDVNKTPYIRVRYQDGAGTQVGTSLSAAGNGGVTTPQTLIVDGSTDPAPAGTVKVEVVLMRRSPGVTGAPLVNADITIDAVMVERNRPAGAPTTYFDGSSLYTDSIWNGDANLATSTIWQAAATGSYGWKPLALRTGAFEPKSIIAKDVLATGSISAALLETEMVLATAIIAGTPGGSRIEMSPAGFSVWQAGATVADVQFVPGSPSVFRGIVEAATFRTAASGQRLEITSGSRTMTFHPASGGQPAVFKSVDDGSGHGGLSLDAGGGDAGHGFLNFTSGVADLGYWGGSGGTTSSFLRVDPEGILLGVRTGKGLSITTDVGTTFFTGGNTHCRIEPMNSDAPYGAMWRVSAFYGRDKYSFGQAMGAIDSDVYAKVFISSNGSNGFVYFSDEKLKRGIRNAEFDALRQVKNTPVREFTWEQTGNLDVGFVAQEVPASAQVHLAPPTNDDSASELLGVSVDRMVVIMWKALQEIANAARI